MMAAVILVLVFACAFTAVYVAWSVYGPGLGAAYAQFRRRRRGLFLAVSPLLEALTSFNERHLAGANPYLSAIRLRLRQAGMLGRCAPAEFVAVQELVGLAALALGLLLVLFPGTGVNENPLTALAFLLVLAVFAAMAPLMPVDSAAARRRREITQNWPFLLDLLTISVESGIDIVTAIRRVLATSPLNAMTEELVQFTNEINLGKSRAEALRDLAERIQVPMVTAVLAMIAQAERLGTPLAPVLRVQAQEFRQKRSAYVEKLAMEAPVKMLFPLLVCIFPAILIVLLGPVLIQYYAIQ